MDYTFESTSKNGNDELKRIFNEINKRVKHKFEISFPDNKFSVNDCVVTSNNKRYLVEHKSRNISNTFLTCLYDSKLMLEKWKYDSLLEKKEKEGYADVLYISTLNDGITYIFLLSKSELKLDTSYSPNASCDFNKGKRMKLVYYLNINDALKITY